MGDFITATVVFNFDRLVVGGTVYGREMPDMQVRREESWVHIRWDSQIHSFPTSMIACISWTEESS
ncbi:MULTISPECIES: hypothetical protein [Kitasatospora]